jgi:hypothetical protein
MAGSPMSSPSSPHESHKLVRCQVINRYREATTRFVEIEAFKLWEYLMSSKHGLQVADPSLCLWVDEEAYRQNASVFEHAGQVEPVDRIVVELFDAAYGFSQTSIRYARASECDQVVEILRSHIPAAMRDSDDCSIAVVSGQVIRQDAPRPRQRLTIGLEG